MTALGQKCASFLERLNRVALFVALAIPISLCFIVALYGGHKPSWLAFLDLPKTLLYLGLAVFATRALYMFFDRVNHEWEDFQSEFKFAVLHAGTAWSLGVAIASVLAGLYFALPEARAHERFGTVFGFYFSVLGVTMAVHAFYRQYAPITNMDFLLLRLIDDLKNKERCHRLYFTYPALNIGYYRHRRAAGNDAHLHSEDIFWKFLEAMRESAPRCRTKVTLLTYPLEEYSKLYEAYAKLAASNPNQPELDVAKDAAANAVQFIEDVIGGDFRYGNLQEIEPQEFPQHCIIIGDVIYTVVTFNMPIFKPAAKDFEPVRKASEHGKLADLYVYRREDKGFADAVARHIDEFIKLRGIALTQVKLSASLQASAPAQTPSQKTP
jgi:hypothetical protein